MATWLTRCDANKVEHLQIGMALAIQLIMNNTKRIEIANKLAALLTVTTSGRTWVGRVWQGGEVVRVYVTRSGAEQGYYSVDSDGDVHVATAMNRSYVVDRAIDAIAQEMGVEVYS